MWLYTNPSLPAFCLALLSGPITDLRHPPFRQFFTPCPKIRRGSSLITYPPLDYLPGACPQILHPRGSSRPVRKISPCRARNRSGTSLSQMAIDDSIRLWLNGFESGLVRPSAMHGGEFLGASNGCCGRMQPFGDTLASRGQGCLSYRLTRFIPQEQKQRFDNRRPR
jgi:hypothetical protein